MIATALDLVAREGAILLVLGAVGSGPAALLPNPLPGVARIAVAPAFGLALSAGVLLTASQVMPMATACWVVLVPLAVLSVAYTVWRTPQPGLGARGGL